MKIDGEIIIVEVKNGPTARLNSNQKINYPEINRGQTPIFDGPNGSVVPQNRTIKIIVIKYTASGRIIFSPYK